MDEETRMIQLKTPKDLKAEFKAKARSEGRSMKWLLLSWIKNYLKKDCE